MVRHSEKARRVKRERWNAFPRRPRIVLDLKQAPKPGSCWDPILVGAANAA